MIEVNPFSWFGERELSHIPPHFIKSTTSVNRESYLWVLSKLTGRFSVGDKLPHLFLISYLEDIDDSIYFEDPKEAMLYELRWAGN